jgi:hypothetical protein
MVKRVTIRQQYIRSSGSSAFDSAELELDQNERVLSASLHRGTQVGAYEPTWWWLCVIERTV